MTRLVHGMGGPREGWDLREVAVTDPVLVAMVGENVVTLTHTNVGYTVLLGDHGCGLLWSPVQYTRWHEDGVREPIHTFVAAVADAYGGRPINALQLRYHDRFVDLPIDDVQELLKWPTDTIHGGLLDQWVSHRFVPREDKARHVVRVSGTGTWKGDTPTWIPHLTFDVWFELPTQNMGLDVSDQEGIIDVVDGLHDISKQLFRNALTPQGQSHWSALFDDNDNNARTPIVPAANGGEPS